MEKNIENKKRFINENYSHIEKNKDITVSEKEEIMKNMSKDAFILFVNFFKESIDHFLAGYYEGLKLCQSSEFHKELISSKIAEEIFYIGCRIGSIDNKKEYKQNNYFYNKKNKDLAFPEKEKAMKNMSNEAMFLYDTFVQEISNQFLDGYYDGFKSSESPEFYNELISSTLMEEIYYVGCQIGSYENKKLNENDTQKVKK